MELGDDATQCRACESRHGILRSEHQRKQRFYTSGALRLHDSVLAMVDRQCVDQHRSLTDQQVAGLVQHESGLLLLRRHLHEAHGGSGHRFADCLGIGGIGLAALHVWLHVSGRHQPHLMTKRANLPAPLVRRCSSLHTDEVWRQLGEELQHLCSANLHTNDGLACRINSVDLNHVLAKSRPTTTIS